MHKYVYYRLESPSLFSKYFDLNKSIHQHDTRQKEHFHTYSVQSEIEKWLQTIYLQTLKQPNHSRRVNINLKCTYYSL